MIGLFRQATTNGLSNVHRLDSDKSSRDDETPNRMIISSGVFDGATVVLRVSATGNAGTFADVTGNSFSSAQAKYSYLPNEIYVQAEITNASAQTSINLEVV